MTNSGNYALLGPIESLLFYNQKSILDAVRVLLWLILTVPVPTVFQCKNCNGTKINNKQQLRIYYLNQPKSELEYEHMKSNLYSLALTYVARESTYKPMLLILQES